MRRQLEVALQPVLRLALAQKHDALQQRGDLHGDRFQHVNLPIARFAPASIVRPERADRACIRFDRQANGRRRSRRKPCGRLPDFIAAEHGPAAHQGPQVGGILGQAANRRGDRVRFALRHGPAT